MSYNLPEASRDGFKCLVSPESQIYKFLVEIGVTLLDILHSFC